jgi:hypothetical protein
LNYFVGLFTCAFLNISYKYFFFQTLALTLMGTEIFFCSFLGVISEVVVDLLQKKLTWTAGAALGLCPLVLFFKTFLYA